MNWLAIAFAISTVIAGLGWYESWALGVGGVPTITSAVQRVILSVPGLLYVYHAFRFVRRVPVLRGWYNHFLPT